MSNQDEKQSVPSYLACAKPNPAENRAPWYKNIAPTYAGVFLWFVFWSGAASSGAGDAPGGIFSQGWLVPLLGVALGGLICYVLFYHVFGRFGQRTGLPLYIVGASTFGATGGLIMPGFLMGLLQFGWIAVNCAGAAAALNVWLKLDPSSVGYYAIIIVWGVLSVIMALKGIKYVALISTYLPLIPAAILLYLLFKTVGGLGSFDAAALVAAAGKGTAAAAPEAATAPSAFSTWAILALLVTYIVGFTATAGAAGCDFGTNARHKKDVVWGGLVGVFGAITLTAGIAVLIVAGFYGTEAGKAMIASGEVVLDPIKLIGKIMGNESAGGVTAFLLALCAFPSCCFSALIAATSIKTTLPKVNPWVSCGIGCAVALILALTGVAAKLPVIFGFFGASFGPICGAMVAEYLLGKGRWTGPRAGFNPAGWIAWVVGFAIGAEPQLVDWGVLPCAKIPLSLIWAFFAGAIIYALLYKCQSRILPYPQAENQAE
ncbi:MAG: cytosine permease [Kiritimatiellae bacterium]|nr:cytosine permease [Kiritimatiellia bacterium]